MSRQHDHIHVPADATIGQVLRAYVERQAQWWWLLVAEVDGRYCVCSFGSLLPYLTGRTEHIVHNIGDCALCSGMDPLLWREAGALVKVALADEAICSRTVGDLPLAELTTVEARELQGLPAWSWLMSHDLRACGITENGALTAVEVLVMRGDSGDLPDF